MTNRSVVALTVGAVIGLALGGAVGGALHFVLKVKGVAEARRGWNLVPVVVAARSIAPGAMVRMEDISQRSIPEQFFTQSVVRPDSASYVVNQAVLVPVAAGEPLRWAYFEGTRAAQDEGPGGWLASEAERAACAAELKARGLSPKATSSEAIRQALKGGAR
ncbi:MAG: SAF domain-containing protein [Myxococcota bacterium]